MTVRVTLYRFRRLDYEQPHKHIIIIAVILHKCKQFFFHVICALFNQKVLAIYMEEAYHNRCKEQVHNATLHSKGDKDMINTNKEVGFYTDVFGNEITEYEQIKRYTVWYNGYLFDGDTDGYNQHEYDIFEDAIALYNVYGDMIHIIDNEYDIRFDYGDWN